MWRLKNYDTPPPGLFVYVQKFGDVAKKFGPLPIIEDLAREVSAARTANGKLRSDLASCLEDVDCYQCKRLGNMPAYCTNTEPGRVFPAPNIPLLRGCGGCGAKVT